MVFVKTSHCMQKCHNCQFLECKEGRLELVTGGDFCQINLNAFTFVLVACASDNKGGSNSYYEHYVFIVTSNILDSNQNIIFMI
jgi:hypothetical protein